MSALQSLGSEALLPSCVFESCCSSLFRLAEMVCCPSITRSSFGLIPKTEKGMRAHRTHKSSNSSARTNPKTPKPPIGMSLICCKRINIMSELYSLRALSKNRVANLPQWGVALTCDTKKGSLVDLNPQCKNKNGLGILLPFFVSQLGKGSPVRTEALA